MEFHYISASGLQEPTDLCVIAVNSKLADDTLYKAIDGAMGGHLTNRGKAEDFSGKSGQSLFSDRPCGAAKSVALIGIENGSFAASIRNFSANATRIAKRCGAAHVTFILPDFAAKQPAKAIQLAVEGSRLASYRFVEYRPEEQKKAEKLLRVNISGTRHWTSGGGKKAAKLAKPFLGSKEANAAVERGEVIAASVCHARTMINEPAAAMTPNDVANQARAVAKKYGLECTVFGRKECEKLGMGMFLAVGQGSAQEPKFIHMVYKPKKKAKKRLALIGKGVTFDSGGYSLKPSDAMLDMKVDMSGAAAVVASMAAIAELGSDMEVHALAACCENMVSGHAYKLGDVLRAMDGTTVEINNTDAEGRLTLGDVLVYAREKIEPDEMIDFATLTGACVVALGNNIAGVFSSDDDMAKRWLKSANDAGEDMWRMPLASRLKEQLKSPIADMRNTGERWGGAITAALFLKHFAKDTPWVHVDIAGPATSSRDIGATSRGGVGFAVSSIVEYVCN